jgi:hypothetical protein
MDLRKETATGNRVFPSEMWGWTAFPYLKQFLRRGWISSFGFALRLGPILRATPLDAISCLLNRLKTSTFDGYINYTVYYIYPIISPSSLLPHFRHYHHSTRRCHVCHRCHVTLPSSRRRRKPPGIGQDVRLPDADYILVAPPHPWLIGDFTVKNCYFIVKHGAADLIHGIWRGYRDIMGISREHNGNDLW